MIELCNTTQTLLGEIKDKTITQRRLAMTYRLAMESSEKTDWHAVNLAILDRWSLSGLERIKRLAVSGRCFDE